MSPADKIEKAGRAIEEAFRAFNAAVARTPHEEHGFIIGFPDRLIATVEVEPGTTVSVEMPVRRKLESQSKVYPGSGAVMFDEHGNRHPPEND